MVGYPTLTLPPPVDKLSALKQTEFSPHEPDARGNTLVYQGFLKNWLTQTTMQLSPVFKSPSIQVYYQEIIAKD